MQRVVALHLHHVPYHTSECITLFPLQILLLSYIINLINHFNVTTAFTILQYLM